MSIFVNEVGYLPSEKKIAILKSETDFTVVDAVNGNEVYKGHTTKVLDKMDAASGDDTFIADFSDLKGDGSYYIVAADNDKSPCFEIKEHVYRDLKNAMQKALYFQRCGCELEEKHAGIYKHKCCHTAPVLTYGTDAKPRILNGGWHDAGDFGRYTTAGAVAVAHLLYAYELMPESFTDEINIPESGNGISDLLNECRYELDFLIQMQREDGGVYHKLTSWRHAPFVMPEEDDLQFYLYPVSSMAVGDFVGIMALASRVYKSVDANFSKRTFEAAKKSYKYLMEHPEFKDFKNPEDSGTGEYNDEQSMDLDERMWAAAEMLSEDTEASAEELSHYMKSIEAGLGKIDRLTEMGWSNVSGLAGLALLSLYERTKKLAKDTDDVRTSAIEEYGKAYRDLFVAEAERLISLESQSGYLLSMDARDFIWGSNMVVCNRGMVLITAYRLTGEDKYKDAALNMLHYLLGRNAMGVSYVTGFGEHAFKNPHNRPTAMDGIDDPMPGWVSGGPNGRPCDEDALKCIPEGAPPMKCYADVVGGYSVNEITIYWNSPAIYIAAFFD